MGRITRNLRKVCKNPSYLFELLCNMGFYKNMDDKKYLIKYYKARTGKTLDIDDPKTFNEKLQWLKLYYRDPVCTEMVDKYAVKKYVENRIGIEHIIPTLGVWRSFDDIDIDKLPDKFVLKCTHDSGGLVICKDRSKLNIEKARNKLNKCLKRNYYYRGREYPYKNVEPRIIAEPYLSDDTGSGLRDYKVFCFNGVPHYIQVDFDRFECHRRNIYTSEWELTELEIKYPCAKDIIAERPEQMNEMLRLAAELSEGYPFLRTDFYLAENKVLFGELTFFPENGFGKITPETWDRKLGDLIILPRH